MKNMPCVNTILLNRYQAQIDAEAFADAAEERRWERMWDELDAALAAGILSDESYQVIRQAMDEDLKS